MKLVSLILFLLGVALFAWALAMVYRPLCPAFLGLACIWYGRVTFTFPSRGASAR